MRHTWIGVGRVFRNGITYISKQLKEPCKNLFVFFSLIKSCKKIESLKHLLVTHRFIVYYNLKENELFPNSVKRHWCYQ